MRTHRRRFTTATPLGLSGIVLYALILCGAVQAQNLEAAYSFDAGSGSTVADVSGHSNVMTLNGPRWVAGRFGNALSFDGSNDVSVASAANAALNLAGRSLTLSAWIYPRSNSGWQMIVNKPFTSGHSSPYFDWSMHREASTGRLVAYLGCDRQQRTSQSAVPVNVWTHVAVTYDGSAIRHFINGVLDRTTAVTCAVTNTRSSPVRIGANGAGGEVLNGPVDDVRVYSRALTAAQIRSDMSTPLSGGSQSPPTLAISADPATAPSGSSSTITWSSTNASACSASGAWSGTKAAAGSQSTSAQMGTSVYTLTCTGAGGSVVRSATVTIASGVPAPAVNLSASPASVPSGGSASLTWSSADASSCVASGAWSGNRSTSGSASTGKLTAPDNLFTLTCSGNGGTTSRSARITVTTADAGPTRGLDFRGSASTTGTVRFRFSNPLAIYPATYIWRLRPRQQTGYYTTFFWGNDGVFTWGNGNPYSADSYYGAHPYPPGGSGGSTHKWEIAGMGNDFLSSENVVYDTWYTQALRVWSDASGKHHEFYWDLPNTSRVIRVNLPADYGNRNPPAPALTFGDAPWAPSKEILNGVLRGIQIYSIALSPSEVLSEVANPLSTSKGVSSIWYMNLNPTPADISDKSGRGHNPAWVGSERPLQWSGN